ncbi:desulfoferrodoxin [Sedimentisphaera salicampi]|uniref:Desulfoferrodoxin n=1 Tax=Sedimentisphaera salicampi TaxID=1941349 RepID=A0A1W6LMA0_9BACT|nr:desulfoferrodoxin [Sedimentisphaera salicampi]ARN56897.1 Desulfoferrodoxin [Sedimentisphaera salicampi]OXU15066.1 Desulfoferrodoxin [Sedimentisphaera salicampi]
MAKRQQIYFCPVCSNVVEVYCGADGELYCCGAPMRLLEGNTTDAATEKHVPVIEKTTDGYKVSVGSVLHPMAPEHYIMWIELVADGFSYVKFLKPGDEPIAEFKVDAEKITAREYCNKHGLWKAEQ